MNNRVYVGVGDAANKYFAEHWGKGGNAWTSMHDGPTFAAGQKMHLKAEIVDKTIKLWVNEELVLTETMSGIPMDAGNLQKAIRQNKNMSVVMPMKEIREHLWIARCLRGILMLCWRQ